MLYCYCGKIGDGKTHDVMKREIVPALEAGRTVYHNIDGLTWDKIARYEIYKAHDKYKYIPFIKSPPPNIPSSTCLRKFKNKVEIRTLTKIDSYEEEESIPLSACQYKIGSLVVIDEVQLVWDNTLHHRAPKGTLSFIEYHRHFGLDLVFITQNVGRLDSNVRDLVNEFYEIRNLKYMTAGTQKTKYRRRVFLQWPFFESIGANFEQFEIPIFKTYKSEMAAQTKRTYSLPLVWKAGIIAFIIAIVVLISTMKNNLYVQGARANASYKALSQPVVK